MPFKNARKKEQYELVLLNKDRSLKLEMLATKTGLDPEGALEILIEDSLGSPDQIDLEALLKRVLENRDVDSHGLHDAACMVH